MFNIKTIFSCQTVVNIALNSLIRIGNFCTHFGERGKGDGKFSESRCLSVNRTGHLMVCDEGNHRVQVFKLSGKFITKLKQKAMG